MAILLNDTEIKKLLGTVIADGDEAGVRPNAYILRLGATGEFLNTEKEFKLGGKSKGIRIPPGHAVGITAHEKIDFRRETVQKIFPDCDLHGIISPTTDLSREGIGSQTTQVDAGYTGTLNWTITNNSRKEARFLHREKIFRLTIFKLSNGEKPENLYAGDYQSKEGYVSSKRAGAPMGMKDDEWIDAFAKGGPEDKFDELMKSGYPWNTLGTRLKQISNNLETVTNEYADICDSINTIDSRMANIEKEMPNTVRKILKEESGAIQNKWLLGAGALALGIGGLILPVITNESTWNIVKEYGGIIGFVCVIVSIVVLAFVTKQK